MTKPAAELRHEPGYWPLAEMEGMEPEFYFEPTAEETRAEFVVATKSYKRRLDEGDLTFIELREVCEGQALELFLWFLEIPPEQQAAYGKQLRDGLAKVKEARRKTREMAQRVLAKRGV